MAQPATVAQLTTTVTQLTARVHELECELADERGLPRPGEDFRLEMGGIGNGEVSYFAEDRVTKVLVNVKLHGADERRIKRAVIAELRRALLPENINVSWPSKDGVRSIHSSICGCKACGNMGLSPEKKPPVGFSSLINADA